MLIFIVVINLNGLGSSPEARGQSDRGGAQWILPLCFVTASCHCQSPGSRGLMAMGITRSKCQR